MERADRVGAKYRVQGAVGGSTLVEPSPDEGQAWRQQDFIWSVGVESSCLPHIDVDQFEWTQHNQFWRSDIKLVTDELGLAHIRYAIPWSYIEPQRGKYDWTIADERILHCRKLGIVPMVDIMHFGTPRWLPLAVGDPEFPEALERLCENMVRRYRGEVKSWCPFNEPLVTALFSGDFGFWPPHSRKWRGYFPVLARVAVATSRAIRAIRRTQAEAVIVLCDAADHYRTRDESLEHEVAMRNLRRFLLLDLVMGKVDHHHPLYEWMTSYGMSELDLEWLRRHPQGPDVIGLDYYPHSDWQLERDGQAIRQKRADAPRGLHGVATDYHNRYGLPLLVTETSIEGKPINREIWLERIVDDCRRLRQGGVPMLGLTWWPLFDHLDWDGALTHRIGKLHQVGLYRLVRQSAGTLQRVKTPTADAFAALAAQGNKAVGELAPLALLAEDEQEQLPPLGQWTVATATVRGEGATAATSGSQTLARPGYAKVGMARASAPTAVGSKSTGPYGIVVFSHLRWGFVWQRPQQFLSRFARKHPVLFVEEPFFDAPEGTEPKVELLQVMPNVTVTAMHFPPSAADDPELMTRLRALASHALEMANENGAFESPLLWYYSPMDAAWTLGHFPTRGIVYDSMDELSQFSGAPEQLVEVEGWLMKHADVVFTGGRNLYEKKSLKHGNVHFFGCGVEAEHFGLAMDEAAAIPPDIDFISRPILGWFGVIDERVDYGLIGEMARLRPNWSFVMIGPVVKMDPNLLPHSPNLYWLGARDYSVLPNYCRAFDVCMMCFAINSATEFINPTKALEYLATGRPVVSTPVKDVVSQYAELINIAATPQEFVAAAQKALESPDRARIERGLELVKRSTWDAVVEQMQRRIAESIGADDKPKERKIEPMAGVKWNYKHVTTPGS